MIMLVLFGVQPLNLVGAKERENLDCLLGGSVGVDKAEASLLLPCASILLLYYLYMRSLGYLLTLCFNYCCCNDLHAP